MKFGNAAWGFRETPLEKQLEITKKMGLSVLELGIANAPNDIQIGGNTQEVVDLYKKYGISLICAATGNDFSEGNKNDVEKIKKVIDMCADMGVKYLRIFAGFSPVGEVTGERWDTMIECLSEIGGYARMRNVIPSIETHGGVNAYDDGVEHFYTTSTKAEVFYKMLSEIPDNIGVVFDPANLYAVGIKNPEEIYLNIKDRVSYIHMKDFVKLPSGHIKPAACGESDMNWNPIIDSIGDSDIISVFEYENVEDVDKGCQKCLDYITSVINA